MDNPLIEYLLVIKSHWKIVLIPTVFITLLAALIVFFIIPPVFVSTSTVKYVGKSGSSFSSLLSGGGLSDISNLEDISGGSSSKDLSLMEDILTSRRCIEDVINKFDLMNRYKEKYMEKCIKRFRENILEISKNSKSGILEIKVYDESPELAKEINEYLIYLLNKINTEINIQYAKDNKEFIEGRYNSIKKELQESEDSLRIYQDKYGLAPDIVSKSVVSAQVNLESEIKSEELKLELLTKVLSPDQAEIKTQVAKIELLKKTLDDIKNSLSESDDFTLKGAPLKVMNYLRLTREVEIKNKILLYIAPIFEQAKIEEKKDVPSVVTIDNPDLPDLKAKPKRLIITLLSLIISFAILCISTIFYQMYFKKIIKEFKNHNNIID